MCITVFSSVWGFSQWRYCFLKIWKQKIVYRIKIKQKGNIFFLKLIVILSILVLFRMSEWVQIQKLP